MGPKPKKKVQSNGKSGKSKKGQAKVKAEALLQAEQEEAERLEKERLHQEHLAKLEAKYQGKRESELAELNSLEQKFLSAQQWKRDYREQAKWEHFLSCDGTPDPTAPQEINTFMSLWRDSQDEDVQLVMEKEQVVLNLIEKLECLLLEASPDEITEKQRDQYQEFILQLQDLLHQKYNEATQNLLKKASMYEDPETGNMHTVIKDKNTTFCIWVNLKKKARLKRHVFQEAGHSLELPRALAVRAVAVRVLHSSRDLLRAACPQSPGLHSSCDLCAACPQSRGLHSSCDLCAACPQSRGLHSSCDLCAACPQSPGLPGHGASASQHPAEQPREEEDDEGREEPSLPAAEETCSEGRKSAASLKENSNKTDNTKETQEETEKNSDILDVPAQAGAALPQQEPGGREEAAVVDSQQLVPLGGVFHIDALQLPPQPQDVGDWSLVELLDAGLEVYPYSPGEAEDGTQAAIQITLRLPDNVIYFKVPVVARWDPAGQQWRTDGISNITCEAEEKSITFRMDAFYTVALLQDAHLNLPYQAWELHPTGVDEGLFTLTAVFATIQIQIKGHQCMLSSVVVEEQEVLSHITGKWMSPFALRAALKRAGVNIFPAEYSPKYVPVPRKAALAEGKAYEQMALLAAAFAFAHSKWNREAGPEHVVFQASEHLPAGAAKDNKWALYMFSGEKVQNLKLTETREAFSEELEEESEFHSTLYHMLKDSASKEAMDKVERAGFLFVDSVYQLLLATRVLAYS